MSRISNFLNLYEEDEWLRDEKLNIGYYTKKAIIFGSTSSYEAKTEEKRAGKLL